MKITKQLFKANGTSVLEGRIVKWSAPAYLGNYNYAGLARIAYICPADSHPLHTECISGDRLDVAFWDGEILAYSDGGRHVEFEIIG